MLGSRIMKIIYMLLTLPLIFSVIVAQELVISGDQESIIAYSVEQKIELPENIKNIRVSFVEPQNFQSETYIQEIQSVDVKPNPAPGKKEKMTDTYGNVIHHYYWENYPTSVLFKILIQAKNTVKLEKIHSEAAFPLENLSPEFAPFLETTDLVQAQNLKIIQHARELAGDNDLEIEVVQNILRFIVDHLRYDLLPERYDALYALETKRGNCQNYSHLAAAYLRALSIPVRIVNGLTFKKNYSIPVEESEYSFDMAEGRHSWIEVYFPDLGWLPFDAQQTEFFVSNRYLRIEVGKDNDETIQDGLVRWTSGVESGGGVPRLEEMIGSKFLADRFSFVAKEKVPSTRKLLLTPPIEAERVTYAVREIPEIPDSVSEENLRDKQIPDRTNYPKLTYERSFESGNLNFPEQFDFLAAHFVDENAVQIKRQFMVETAEYVTGKEQYTQMFVLQEPVLLKNISLALHIFGGEGLIWVELSEDKGGQPSGQNFPSKKRPVRGMGGAMGYNWVDFDFSEAGLILSPGKYWITLNYSGTPIVNWFYSYGKPVGPVDGTRIRNFEEANWGKILNFEFNYRVQGLGTSE